METTGEKVDNLRKKENLSYSKLASIVGGIKGDGMRKAIIRNSISLAHINILHEKLGWDKSYLLGLEDNGMTTEEPKATYNKVKKDKIPYYELNLTSSDLKFSENGLVEKHDPLEYICIPKTIDADLFLMCFGNAMSPLINNGDKIALKHIKDWSFFNYGLKHMIVTEEQVLVRYLRKSNTEGNILLVAENSDFEDIELPIKSIKQIFQVRYICKSEM